ncbi:MAG TPA: hypothetical protein VIR01_05480 [Pyrinomonadaceae bacterium]
MKNLRVLLCLLMLLPLLSIAPGAYTQTGLNAERDVEATVATQEPNIVLGKVINKSANVYPCIRLLVNLRDPISPKHLGTFPIYFQNLKAQETRDYSQLLPFPAIATQKAIGACQWDDKDDPANFPHIISFTVSRTRIHPGETATLEWKTFNTEAVLFNQRNPTAGFPPPNAGRPLALSGSMTIRPRFTTKYYIEAKKWAYSAVGSVMVEVVPFRPDDE